MNRDICNANYRESKSFLAPQVQSQRYENIKHKLLLLITYES